MAVTEYDHEPVRGLPGQLPPGESILWQGAPDAKAFAASALFSRWVTAYFIVLAAFAIAAGDLGGAAATLVAGLLGIGLLGLFATAIARTTVYTLTSRRVVMRIGIALNMCINIPLKAISGADLRSLPAGHGDIALSLSDCHRLGYGVLWPHARPWRFARPQPMLRAVPQAATVAKTLAEACAGRPMPDAGQETAAASAPSYRPVAA